MTRSGTRIAARQERPVDVVDQHKRVVHQWGTRRKTRPRRRIQRRQIRQVERQPHRRPAAGHIVVEVAVEPLEPGVEIRKQTDDKELDVLFGQGGRARQCAQTKLNAVCLGGVGTLFERSSACRRGVGAGGVSASSASTTSSLRYSPRNGSSGAGSGRVDAPPACGFAPPRTSPDQGGNACCREAYPCAASYCLR